jgi:hypothetical protein
MTAVAAAFALVATALFVPVVPASAQSSIENGINSANGDGVPDQLFGDGSIFTTIVNVMLFIIGAICVIMLIWGGIRYTTSAGNSASVTAAKNTIMYAIIGLVIAFLAFAVVNWVLVAITPGSGATQ